jgi:catechol 2,3-dioxygenase-like lactoylglutathione lyase family enzyme
MNAPEFFASYPVLACADISRAVDYYRDVLGFKVKVISPDNAYAIVERNQVELHLDSPVYAREHAVGNGECYVWIKGDIDALYAEFAQRSALQLHPVADRLYKMRDFSCCDPDGNRITFGAEIH